MSKYIIRLDDACEKMDIEKWNRMENILDKYGVKPLVGVIPNCQDKMMDSYAVDEKFWDKVKRWEKKGWEIALHGYNHVYSTKCGGINPVNQRSEFAGESLEIQKVKIKKGIKIMREHDVNPKVFFAPSHTFDENTLRALKEESNINIISDTIANDIYFKDGFYFIPQQSGRVRKLPFRIVTFCYHPNMMNEAEFEYLDNFIKVYVRHFEQFSNIVMKNRVLSFCDKILQKLYFIKRK